MTTDTDAARIAIIVRSPRSRHAEQPDGFSFRYWYIVDSLASTNEVLLVHESGLSNATEPPTNERVALREMPFPRPSRDGYVVRRAWQLQTVARHLVRRSSGQRWEEEILTSVRDWGTDIVIALTNYTLADAVPLAREFPTIVFAEENLSMHPRSGRSRSPVGRAFIALEQLAIGRYVRQLAADVVIISPTEHPWASASFPRSKIHVVPHFIDLEYWQAEAAEDSTIPSDVFVVGAMEQARNAEGLASILRELVRLFPDQSLPTVSVASMRPPHASLINAGYPGLRLLGPINDVRTHYAGASMTLVPSFVVTGAKTTILQGWATGTPVVTTDKAAESVGGTDGVDLLVGTTPGGVAAQLKRLFESPDQGAALVAQGRASLERRHSPSAAMVQLRALVAEQVRSQGKRR